MTTGSGAARGETARHRRMTSERRRHVRRDRTYQPHIHTGDHARHFGISCGSVQRACDAKTRLAGGRRAA